MDGFALVRELVLQHQGVGLLPQSLCKAELASGAVAPVLPSVLSGSIRLHLTFPSRADRSPEVNAFAQVLVRHLDAAVRR